MTVHSAEGRAATDIIQAFFYKQAYLHYPLLRIDFGRQQQFKSIDIRDVSIEGNNLIGPMMSDLGSKADITHPNRELGRRASAPHPANVCSLLQ
jgi:hypothetical protein